MDFSTLELHPSLQRSVQKLGFERPTPIQSLAIPAALNGRDLLACAATGSGKTAAFLLPVLHQVLDKPRGTTRALILAPTRELAIQIVDDLIGLARHTGVRAAAVYGGVGMGPQEKAFRKGVDIIVATPGRLLDHFTRPYAALSGLEFLILDEADRMLDMGFLPDIKRVLRHVPKPKQTLFFSATMPPPIEKLARELLTNPAKIALQQRAAPAEGVAQTLYPVPGALKAALLFELLKRGPVDDALVFTRTKHRADRLAKQLNRQGISAERIHGNRSQAQRTRALSGFKAGKYQVLVATDVAARGIDVEALGHVVNFDVPTVPEDYIHRVGRTARAGARGDAFTLVSPECEANVARIERAVGKKLPRAQLEGFSYAGGRASQERLGGRPGAGGKRSSGPSDARTTERSSARDRASSGRSDARANGGSKAGETNSSSRSGGRSETGNNGSKGSGGRPRRRPYGRRRR